MPVNIVAPCNNLGYGVAGFHIVKELSELARVSFWPIGNIELPNPSAYDIIQCAIDNQSDYDVDAPSIRIFHQFSLDLFPGKGERIGWPIFELDTFNSREIHHLKNVDWLITCCRYNTDTIRRHINKKVVTVPLGVDRIIFNEKNVKTNENLCVFCHIGKSEFRKGHDVIIKAFCKAFSKKDRVVLWMMADNPFLSKEQKDKWINIYKNHELSDKVVLLNRVRYQSDVAKIIKMSDCGVFPSRAEGFNLELLEFMSCGKPVICTDFSAHEDYCNNENSMLIHIDDVEPAEDNIWGVFHKQGKWGKLTSKHIDIIAEYMRHVFTRKMAGDCITNYSGIETAKQMTWTDTANKIYDILFISRCKL